MTPHPHTLAYVGAAPHDAALTEHGALPHLRQMPHRRSLTDDGGLGHIGGRCDTGGHGSSLWIMITREASEAGDVEVRRHSYFKPDTDFRRAV